MVSETNTTRTRHNDHSRHDMLGILLLRPLNYVHALVLYILPCDLR